MTTEAAAAPATAPAATPPEKPEAGPKAYHVNEMKTGHQDPFTAAYNEAQDELRGEEEKPKAKAKPKAEPKKEEPAPKKQAAKPEPKDEADEGEEEADDEAEAKPEQPAKPQKLEAKRWWSGKKREAFAQMPRHIQEEWLSEAPKADQRWTEEAKAAFAKLPSEGQEILLERQQELERGYNEKFMATAAERKLAEEVKAAVPPQIRAFMQSRGLSETQVFSKLLGYQQQAMTDPLGYVRQFIASNKINPLDIIPMDGGTPSGSQPAPQADVKSHPAFQAVSAELNALKASVNAERQRRESERGQQAQAEFQGLLSEADGEGNSLYPFIRVLADPMAQIISSDPERFGSLSVKDRLTVAYHQALDDFPELSALRITAPKPKADEPAGNNADFDADEERVAKLERAITPKSRTAQATPAQSGAVSLDDALSWAQKRIGKR